MRRLAISVAALLSTAAGAARAECPTITPRVDALAPADGLTGLPENAAISFGLTPRFAGYAPSVTLTANSGGGAVPGALVAGPAESFLFLPDSPLSADASYTVQIVDSSGAGTPLTTTFSTGSGNDTTDPVIAAAPTLEIVDYTDPVRTSSCLQPGYFVLRADWEDVVSETSVLYVLDANFEDLIPQEITAAGHKQPMQPRGESLVAAESERLFNAPSDSIVRAQIYAIDGAGRQGHSPQGSIETPPDPDGGGKNGCGCDLSGGGVSPLASIALSLLALVGITRRRR